MNGFTDGPSQMHHRRSRPWHDRRNATPKDRIRLDTIGRTISVMEAISDPYLSQLMSEDTCWRFAHGPWEREQPSRWNRSRWRQWQNEGKLLALKKMRIEQLASDLGLTPRPVLPVPLPRRFGRLLVRILFG